MASIFDLLRTSRYPLTIEASKSIVVFPLPFVISILPPVTSNSSLYLQFVLLGVTFNVTAVTVSFTFTLYVVVLLTPFSVNVTVNGKSVCSVLESNPVTFTLESFIAITVGVPVCLVTKISPGFVPSVVKSNASFTF